MKTLSINFDCLSDREKETIRMFFGIQTDAKTLEEIAEKHEVTKERIRQMRNKAIRKLQKNNPDFIIEIQKKAQKGLLISEHNFTFDKILNDLAAIKICPNCVIVKDSRLKHAWGIDKTNKKALEVFLDSIDATRKEYCCLCLPVKTVLDKMTEEIEGITGILNIQDIAFDYKNTYSKNGALYFEHDKKATIAEKIKKLLDIFDGCAFTKDIARFLKISEKTVLKAVKDDWELYDYELIQNNKICIHKKKGYSTITKCINIIRNSSKKTFSVTDMQKYLDETTNLFLKEKVGNRIYYRLKDKELLKMCLNFFIDEEIGDDKGFEISEIIQELDSRDDLFIKKESGNDISYFLQKRAQEEEITIHFC